MKVIVEDCGGCSKLKFQGRLDATSSAEADSAFSGLIDAGSARIFVDMSELDYISSAGLRVLLVAAKRVQQKGGRIALFGLSENVKDVFEISGFASVFKIGSGEADALAFVKS